MGQIILFDGVCHFCQGSVQFILKRDSTCTFSFASLQGNTGKELIKQYNIGEDLNSLVLIDEDLYYVKSDAVLRICSKLRMPWKLLSVVRIVPRPIRDLIYDLVANNRYKWFGKKEICTIPSAEMRKRFLD
ncbi:thiol-disulfide oxidoreductase DCC family protein [Halalkalibacter kiskunsagensis]|uniref:Thiol-disulfide oxidoreductase DCC family protein n=1 Tax=Halalkalibacter kiskunsagensis TaxID=1548599 RepID=A0ABV6K9X2_9BACI